MICDDILDEYIKEMIDAIISEVPEDELRTWANKTQDAAISEAHFGIALWIRNNYLYGNRSPIAAEIQKSMLWVDEDSSSGVLVGALWTYLNVGSYPKFKELFEPYKIPKKLESDE